MIPINVLQLNTNKMSVECQPVLVPVLWDCVLVVYVSTSKLYVKSQLTGMAATPVHARL